MRVTSADLDYDLPAMLSQVGTKFGHDHRKSPFMGEKKSPSPDKYTLKSCFDGKSPYSSRNPIFSCLGAPRERTLKSISIDK